ncbi:MAG: prenyltransferase/squalene oxidase repeat-containing protein [Planctomycetota bacterium]
MSRLALFVMALFGLVAAPAAAQDNPPAPDRDQVEQAIERGVRYLIAQTDDRDGSIGVRNQYRTATTSLAIMAMVAVGHQPTDQTPQGKALRDALNYILADDRITPDGYLGRQDGSRMYGHGITALMLTEMLGMGVDDRQDELIRVRCRAALDLILRSQQVDKSERYRGGWRYEPGSRDADLSVTVWQLMALRAGKAAGMDVPAQAIDQAVEYLKRSYREMGREKGGFGYEPGQYPRYATTAAGMLAMLVCGRYEHEQVRHASNQLLEWGPQVGDQWFYYGTYYYAIGMYQVGGEHATTAQRETWRVLKEQQRVDGSWQNRHHHESDQVYATSMALLALSVRHHYLPIYQR